MLLSDALINLDPVEIQKYQQNRYPCFFVDCIEEAIPGKSARGYKNFTFNEWFFQHNSENVPVVPEAVQIEALTQVFLMTFLTLPENKGEKTSFISVEAKHIKPVKAGDRLDIKSSLSSFSRGLARGEAVGTTGGGRLLRSKIFSSNPVCNETVFASRELKKYIVFNCVECKDF